MVFDFHTHTSLSDGVLSPIELIRRAIVNGYRAIALTDHASTGELDRIIRETSEICALARAHWDILAIPGIEITHVPAQAIAETARSNHWNVQRIHSQRDKDKRSNVCLTGMSSTLKTINAYYITP